MGKNADYPRVIVKKEISELLTEYFYQCKDGWNGINYFIMGLGLDFLNYKLTLLKQLAAKKNDKKVYEKIMKAITDFNFINVPMRKIGALSHEIITPEEVKNALK